MREGGREGVNSTKYSMLGENSLGLLIITTCK